MNIEDFEYLAVHGDEGWYARLRILLRTDSGRPIHPSTYVPDRRWNSLEELRAAFSDLEEDNG